MTGSVTNSPSGSHWKFAAPDWLVASDLVLGTPTVIASVPGLTHWPSPCGMVIVIANVHPSAGVGSGMSADVTTLVIVNDGARRSTAIFFRVFASVASLAVDVHPAPSTYDEIVSLMSSYGKVVKQRDPWSKTLGPAEWGWLNYFDSAALERGTLLVDFIPYYLLQAKLYEQINGTRVLDYLDLHVFPQAMAPDTGRITAGDTSAATNALRLRSTAVLWDPNYVAES